VYDHTSILRMIESRWSLPSLSVRDRTANNLGSEFRASPQLSAPQLAVPGGPFGAPCPPPPATPPLEETFAPVLRLAGLTGAAGERIRDGADARLSGLRPPASGRRTSPAATCPS
jgi:hypothetical protein